MSAFPNSPRLIKGGIVLVDPDSGTVQKIIVLQYNPDSLSGHCAAGRGEGGDRSEAMRLKGPPVETIKLDAELDAIDQLEFPIKTAAVDSGFSRSSRTRNDRLSGSSSTLYENSMRMRARWRSCR